jgi:glycosyltransferase involved in cell wall biosynthesis
LLHLGFAFPPGVAALHPGVNPAGHALETSMVAELRQYFCIRSVGVLPFCPPPVEHADPGSGIAHELILLEKAPELFHRFRSWVQLVAQYRSWRAQGWEPEAVLVYNLSPIYNRFVMWLRRQPRCPKLVLLLSDSPTLGVPLPWIKRHRRRFKPMHIPDSSMLEHFDACIGLSKAIEQYFRPRKIPFLWMPGGCSPERLHFETSEARALDNAGPFHLGYFGALGPHAGVRPLVDTLLSTNLPVSLELCGYGKPAQQLASIARRDSRVRFHGLLTPAECMTLGQSCDALVNPRPATHGNQNNFPSKLFEYALTGKPILTSRLSGVEEVLGPEAFYFDAYDFVNSLKRNLQILVSTSSSELRHRGAAIQQRIISEFSWRKQATRVAGFIHEVRGTRVATTETEPVVAA